MDYYEVYPTYNVHDLMAALELLPDDIPRTKTVSQEFSRVEEYKLGSLFDLETKQTALPGRRIRTLPALWREIAKDFPVIPSGPQTYGELYVEALPDGNLHDALSSFSLRTHYAYMTRDSIIESIPEDRVNPWTKNGYSLDPQLPIALADLAYAIGHDLTLACDALDDPDIWYPGVDEGIQSVPDEHVNLIIWASQRELDRETRRNLPSVNLQDLPFRVQRAFVERRRWHYLQYGIDSVAWLNNTWSFWNIKEDADWIPPWHNA